MAANLLCTEKAKLNPFEIPREQYCEFDPDHLGLGLHCHAGSTKIKGV